MANDNHSYKIHFKNDQEKLTYYTNKFDTKYQMAMQKLEDQ